MSFAMPLTLLEKKEKIHGMADLFLDKINTTSPDAKIFFYNIIDSVIEESSDIREVKVDRSEVKDLIIEMRHGFAMMEKRFEQVDKRFEDMQKYMDKRFEAVDKRFESVDKRFESVDKRFEDINERFRLMFWFMGAGFTILSVLLTVFRFAKP